MNVRIFQLAAGVGLLAAGCGSFRFQETAPGESGPVTQAKIKSVPALLTELLESKRVVFLGDSITYSGQYIDDLEIVLRRVAPGNRIEFVNLGLPSETVSGLSEPGHAGGAFPRPNLHERLERLLNMTRPDLVFACYGMNDGIYYPLDARRFEAYQRGISLLRERVLKAGAKLVLLTPPVFDPAPIRTRTLPAGRSEYPQPYEGYDEVLERYSEWLLTQRGERIAVLDVHSPMKHYLQQQRLTNPGFVFATDGVHINEHGHWLMATAILEGLNVPDWSDGVTVDLTAGKVAGTGEVIGASKQNGTFSFIWRTRPSIFLVGPYSDETKMRRRVLLADHNLIAQRGQADLYRIFESDRMLATLSSIELAGGIDTRRFSELQSNRRGIEILRLIHQRNRLLSDAWLSAVGHKRPGMKKGLPMREALSEAEALTRKIVELHVPVDLRWRFVPVKL